MTFHSAGVRLLSSGSVRPGAMMFIRPSIHQVTITNLVLSSTDYKNSRSIRRCQHPLPDNFQNIFKA
jgi:hypothetical protein